MKLNKKHILLIITLILGFSLLIGNASATTIYTKYNKTTTIYKSQMLNDGSNYYKNKYIKISLGKTYVNGRVYGTNPATGKVELAPVYAQKVKITALSTNVKINKVYIRSIGYPSWNYYYNKYYNINNQWITPGKYKSFNKFTVYYTVTKTQEKRITAYQAKQIAAQFTSQKATGDVIYNSNYNYYQVYLVPKDPNKKWPDYRFVDAATGSIVQWINGVLRKIS